MGHFIDRVLRAIDEMLGAIDLRQRAIEAGERAIDRALRQIDRAERAIDAALPRIDRAERAIDPGPRLPLPEGGGWGVGSLGLGMAGGDGPPSAHPLPPPSGRG